VKTAVAPRIHLVEAVAGAETETAADSEAEPETESDSVIISSIPPIREANCQ
jgi:hypothetical protein